MSVEKPSRENLEDNGDIGKSEVFSEELVRKTTRVVLKSAEKGRESLFYKLTSKNAERIAKLLKQKPIFWEKKETGETEILLDPEISDAMPIEFFENPTKWIEAQSNIDRMHNELLLPTGENIGELFSQPYDISKVKEFTIGGDDKKINVVSKRIDPKETEEIVLAVKAREAGIPTPKIYGEVNDNGNIYAFFEKIDGISLLSAFERKHLSLGFWFFATEKEDEFNTLLKNAEWEKFISLETKDKIFRLWQKNKDIFEERVATIDLIEIMEVFPILTEDLSSKIKSDLAKVCYKAIEYNKTRLEKYIKKYGFTSVKDLEIYLSRLATSQETKKTNNDYKNIKEACAKRIEEINLEEKKEFFDLLRRMVISEVMGLDIDEELKRIRKICTDNKIEHKDFADRNILIEWDFEKNEPKGKATGDVKLQIIDWEQNSSPKDKKQS